MRTDERRWIVVIGKVAGEERVNYADREILMHLKMKMRCVTTMRISYCSDLVTARDLLTFPHEYSIKMAVQGVCIFDLAVFAERVPHNNDVPPRSSKISR